MRTRRWSIEEEEEEEEEEKEAAAAEARLCRRSRGSRSMR